MKRSRSETATLNSTFFIFYVAIFLFAVHSTTKSRGQDRFTKRKIANSEMRPVYILGTKPDNGQLSQTLQANGLESSQICKGSK